MTPRNGSTPVAGADTLLEWGAGVIPCTCRGQIDPDCRFHGTALPLLKQLPASSWLTDQLNGVATRSAAAAGRYVTLVGYGQEAEGIERHVLEAGADLRAASR